MKIHHKLEAPSTDRPLVLAIGFFDGLHRGHREIVRSLLRLRKPGYRAAVLTFRNHPSTHLRPDRVPPLLTTLDERVNLLASTGLDELYVVPFDERIARLEARTFCDDIVRGVFGARALVIGENFRFGAGRLGDATLARETLEPHGIRVLAVAPVLDGDDRISSTRIRVAVLRGDMDTANRLLGESYAVRGSVTLGEGRGHDLGFPTANLCVPAEKTLPADGRTLRRPGLPGAGFDRFQSHLRRTRAYRRSLAARFSDDRVRRTIDAARFSLHSRAAEIRSR